LIFQHYLLKNVHSLPIGLAIANESRLLLRVAFRKLECDG
jgi:hypothetical protein